MLCKEGRFNVGKARESRRASTEQIVSNLEAYAVVVMRLANGSKQGFGGRTAGEHGHRDVSDLPRRIGGLYRRGFKEIVMRGGCLLIVYLILIVKFNHWLTSCKSAELASR